MYTVLDDLELSQSNPGKGLREYQVIYAGDFRKGDDHFSVPVSRIEDWRDALNAMVLEGIDIPGPIGHSINPELKRANWVGARTGPDSKGRHSLWATAKFDDPKHEETLKASKVSLYAPGQEYKSPTSETVWFDPIRHIAFTSYPAIPDLEPSKGLALSSEECLTTPKKEPEMPLTLEFRNKLKTIPGCSFKDDATDDEVIAAFTGLDTSKLIVKADEPAPAPTPPLSNEPVKPNATVAKLRGFVLDQMVGRNITPAQRKEVTELMLSDMTDAAFDGTVKVLSLSQVLPGPESKTGPQSQAGVKDGNTLLKAVDNRIQALSGK